MGKKEASTEVMTADKGKRKKMTMLCGLHVMWDKNKKMMIVM